MSTYYQKNTSKLCIFCLDRKKRSVTFKENSSIYIFFPNYEKRFFPSVICSTSNPYFQKLMKTGNEKSHVMLLKKLEPNSHASLKWQRNEAVDGEFDCNCFFCSKIKSRSNVAGQPRTFKSRHPRHSIAKKHSDQSLCGSRLSSTKRLKYDTC